MTAICSCCKSKFSVLVLSLVWRGTDAALLCKSCLGRLVDEAR